MAKNLIIGSTGQLGTDCLSVLPEARALRSSELNISDRNQCVDVFDALQPEVIINCAAYTAVDACENDPQCWKVNADGPKYLAEWAALNDVFLVHVSTDYVFPGDKPLFESYMETDPTGPVSEYGRSKLAGEQAICASGARSAILRTAWLYGAHGKNFLKTMLRLTVQNPGKEFKVVHDQFGSPTASQTLARQMAAVVEARSSGLFHATSEGYCSWYDLACSFLDKMGIPHHFTPCSSDEYPTPAKRPENSILENASLKSAGVNLFDHWDVELGHFVDQHKDALLAEAQSL